MWLLLGVSVWLALAVPVCEELGVCVWLALDVPVWLELGVRELLRELVAVEVPLDVSVDDRVGVEVILAVAERDGE